MKVVLLLFLFLFTMTGCHIEMYPPTLVNYSSDENLACLVTYEGALLCSLDKGTTEIVFPSEVSSDGRTASIVVWAGFDDSKLLVMTADWQALIGQQPELTYKIWRVKETPVLIGTVHNFLEGIKKDWKPEDLTSEKSRKESRKLIAQLMILNAIFPPQIFPDNTLQVLSGFMNSTKYLLLDFKTKKVSVVRPYWALPDGQKAIGTLLSTEEWLKKYQDYQWIEKNEFRKWKNAEPTELIESAEPAEVINKTIEKTQNENEEDNGWETIEKIETEKVLAGISVYRFTNQKEKRFSLELENTDDEEISLDWSGLYGARFPPNSNKVSFVTYKKTSVLYKEDRQDKIFGYTNKEIKANLRIINLNTGKKTLVAKDIWKKGYGWLSNTQLLYIKDFELKVFDTITEMSELYPLPWLALNEEKFFWEKVEYFSLSPSGKYLFLVYDNLGRIIEMKKGKEMVSFPYTKDVVPWWIKEEK